MISYPITTNTELISASGAIPVDHKVRQHALIKKGIWLYFILLLAEGALRKWVLPGLATPLLIVRDPVAVWLLILAWNTGELKPNIYLTGMVFIAVISIFTAVFFGHGNFLVALFGGRILFLHFPLIFVIGHFFNREDVVKMGYALICIAIPMTVLMALQFYSPQSAWVNRGIGGDVNGGGFDGANGFFRPPTTFSFITGTASFFTLVAAFIFYFWLSKNKINRLILLAATLCLVIAIPLSISRTLFFGVAAALVFAMFVVVRNPKYLIRMIAVFGILIVVFIIVSKTDSVQTALTAFTDRFTSANEGEGGLNGVLIDRFLGGMLGAVSGSVNLPFWGYGIGMGTNVGAMLLEGKLTFLIAEGEWGRMIGEMGFLLSFLAIMLRLGLCIKFLTGAFKKLLRNDILPWMLLSFVLVNIAQGQWSQPTALGFAVLSGGLMLAALRGKSDAE